MKTTRHLFLLTALALAAACGDDDTKISKPDGSPVDPGETPMDVPDASEPDGEAPVDEADADVDPDPMMPGDDAGMVVDDGGMEPVDPDAGEPLAAWYTCQNTDQQFVRKAFLAVLGRRPYSQAEVNVYTDLITQLDAADGITDRSNPPGSRMRRSRRVMLQALFKNPQYIAHWEQLYRDMIRVQRVDEMLMRPCMETPLTTDSVAVAAHVRSKPASEQFGAEFNMADLFKGALQLDDVSPIYTANLFAMLKETYTGANAVEPALELGRRADFGAWFDATYLNRDVVCLGCHNSEFSVTETNNPETNRHFPLPYLLEKSLYGDSMGPPTFGGYDGVERAHAIMKYKDFVNDCSRTQSQAAAGITCPSSDELVWRCMNGGLVCDSVYQRRRARPWGWLEACGQFSEPNAFAPDIAGVEAKFGKLGGLRVNMWDVSETLRTGFLKLRREGLGADENGEVADPDKAFAYLVAMTIVDKAWEQIVGTSLTIPTRYPRNAAARDQMAVLVDAFVTSGYSNQKLVEAILASPYANMPNPGEGCGDTAYGAPAIFDPWVTAEPEPAMRKNSTGDAVLTLPARTAASAMYSALKWPAPQAYPHGNANAAERLFQGETGFFLKNAEPGFKGFDFQARLGWENRFGVCAKLPTVTGPDFIDELGAAVNAAGVATVGDLVLALKDRILGRPYITEAEKPALEALVGASLDDDASSLADTVGGLRKACGVFAASPQFLLTGISPQDSVTVPKLTPAATSYEAACTALETALTGDVGVLCNDDDTLSLLAR